MANAATLTTKPGRMRFQLLFDDELAILLLPDT